MKRKNTIWSLVLALVMVLGVIAPVATMAAQPGNDDSKPSKATETKTVTLHKLMMTKDELKAWNSKEIEEKGYNGEQNLDALKKLLDTGHSAKEADGVYFAWQVKGQETTTVDGKTVPQYIKKSTDAENNMIPAVKEEDGKKVLELTTNIDEAFGGKTDKSAGITFNTEVLKGDLKGVYIIQEIKEKSTYKNDGNVIVDQKAVPVEITLPLVNDKGIVEVAHVYPKNTESKPVIDKNFRKPNADPEKGDLVDKMEGVDLTKEEQDNLKKYDNNTIDLGAVYDNYDKAKAKAKAYVGKSIPYEVKTKIEAGTSYERLIWNDTMTNGLTFNKDVKITVKTLDAEGNPNGTVNLTENTHYKKVQDDNGFRLQMTDDGLKKISEVTLAKEDAKDVEITLTYSATVNGTAVVDNPEKNNVTLEYGHQKGKDLEKKPVTPSNEELTVNKSFDPVLSDKDKYEKNLKIVYTLWNGEKEETATAKASVELNKDSKGTIDLGDGIKFEVTGPFKGKFTGLKDTDNWFISERVAGYNPEYTATENGSVTIVNKKDNENPTPLDPETPEVVVGGKKFVKTSEDKDGTENFDRLAGAKFVVKQGDKYLTVKSVATLEAEKTKLATAKTNLENAVKAYNERTKEQSEEDLKKAINTAQEAYNEAFKAAGIRYEWKSEADAKTDNKFNDDVVTLTSDGRGQFEINGLEYGNYELVEIEAPKDYATRENVPFVVGKDSYKTEKSTDDKGLEGKKNTYPVEYTEGNADVIAKRVVNKKVSIPQTGGMGTALFMVAGLALMGGAFIAMKKRSAEQA